jgi:dolichol-phosphate mannosyltransferase
VLGVSLQPADLRGAADRLALRPSEPSVEARQLLTPPGSQPRTSIVLATLNEREALPRLVQSLTALPLKNLELVIVDDGSTDGTREFIDRLELEHVALVRVFHRGRRTLRQAQLEGFAHAGGEFVVVMDSDLQHPPETVSRIVSELVSGADLVVASRYANGGGVGARPPVRSIISRGAEVLAKTLIPEARVVRDPLSGFFGFRREILRQEAIRTGGYKLLLTLLVVARGRRVLEVPYLFETRPSGESKITGDLRFVPIFLSELLVTRRARRLARAGAGPRAREDDSRHQRPHSD